MSSSSSSPFPSSSSTSSSSSSTGLPKTPPYCECDDCETTDGSGNGAGSGSNHPIRYANGELLSAGASDLSSSGFGLPWGHTRSYGNLAAGVISGVNGNGWMVKQMPSLVFEGTTVGRFGRGGGTLWFQPFGTGFTGMFNIKASLSFDSANDRFQTVEADGTQMLFFGYGTPGLLGKLVGVIAPGGNYSSANYDSSQRLENFAMGSGSVTAVYHYDYYTAGVHSDRLQAVTYRVNGVDVRRCSYEYYDGSDSNGNLNDLKCAIVEQYDGTSGWGSVAHTYYRYHMVGSSYGSHGQLKFVLGPDGYARMVAASLVPEAETDSVLADYADYYFEYDASRRVTLERVDGGAYTYTYAYTGSGGSSSNYNVWVTKTVETLPNGDQNIVYCNFAGQAMLKVLKSGSNSWYEYFLFNSIGQGIQRAESSAVVSYNESWPGLVSLNAGAGLVHEFEYYTNSTDPGYAPNYLKAEMVRQGAGGATVKVRQYTYYKRTSGPHSIYLPGSIALYQSAASGGSSAATTGYTYLSFTGPFRITSKRTNWPNVTANGSGVNTFKFEVYDQYGHISWTKDERGFISYFSHDTATGALIQRIDDVDTTLVSGEPSGWVTPTGGGLHLVTDYEFDLLGRKTQQLGPPHAVDLAGVLTTIRRAQWLVYRDDLDQAWEGRGFATGSSSYAFTLINPVKILQVDKKMRAVEDIQATRASTSGRLTASDTFARSTWTRWKHFDYNAHNKLVAQRTYFLIPSSGVGSAGTNYDQTEFGYDVSGVQNRVMTSAGTITRTVYNPCDWVLSVWIGTDDTGATDSNPSNGGASGNNLKQLVANVYDGGAAGKDGNLTQETQYQDASTSRVTSYGYDFRNRRTFADGEVDFYEVYTYDNLDRITQTDRKNTTSSGALVARSTTGYDARGRVFRMTRYAVSGGTVGNTLIDNFWYDPSGNLIKEASAGSRTFQKTVYDGVNRVKAKYTGYDLTETGYPYPVAVTGDTIMQQVELEYDSANNLLSQLTRERFDDATATGALTTPAGTPAARVSYLALYPDPRGRVIAAADYGTNAASSWTRSDTIPTASDIILLTLTAYNDRNEAWQVTDPKGRINQSTFDDAGRLAKLVENVVSSGSGTDQNKETGYIYAANGQLGTLTAKNSITGDQVTQFVYGTTLSDSDVASNELLRTKIYPDDTTGVPDRDTFAYNRLGQPKLLTDQNGTTRELTYDKLGRQTLDAVTTLGSGVDGAVRRKALTYEVRGMVEKVTHLPASGTTPVNEVQLTYNAFAQLAQEYQEHTGAVSTSTTPKVAYSYADAGSGTPNTVRPTALTYPDGRVLSYDYGTSGGLADALSRIAGIQESATTRAAYSYLGLGTVVQLECAQPGIKMTYLAQGSEGPGDAGDKYVGLDRFGRVADVRWIKSSTDIERVQYGYDRASIRQWRCNPVAATGQDEFYTNDGLHQLGQLQRGTLNSGMPKTGITGTVAREEGFTYDPTGNWSAYLTKTAGTTDLSQTRTHNRANEMTALDSSSSLLGYDLAGNMTTTPQADSWGAAYDLTYDAWNRLVEVKIGTTTVASYAYDALGRRVIKNIGGVPRHYYYSAQWQILEERTGINTIAERQFTWGPRGVDDLLFRDRGGERLYVMHDAMHSTAVSDSSGAVVERYGYDAFGKSRVMDANFATRSISSYEWETRFCSYRWDDESGFYQVRNRYLHPSLGRWLSRDPVGEEDGLNFYAYVGNRPVISIDPLGLYAAGDLEGTGDPYGQFKDFVTVNSPQYCPRKDDDEEEEDEEEEDEQEKLDKLLDALPQLPNLKWGHLYMQGAADFAQNAPGAFANAVATVAGVGMALAGGGAGRASIAGSRAAANGIRGAVTGGAVGGAARSALQGGKQWGGGWAKSGPATWRNGKPFYNPANFSWGANAHLNPAQRAGVAVHELTHITQFQTQPWRVWHATSMLPGRSISMYRLESQAYQAQAQYLRTSYHGLMPFQSGNMMRAFGTDLTYGGLTTAGGIWYAGRR